MGSSFFNTAANMQGTANEEGGEDMEEDDGVGWETASDEDDDADAHALPSNAGAQDDAAASASQACMHSPCRTGLLV